MEAQSRRIEAVIGDCETLEDGVRLFYDHLLRSLELPCEVTGIEDFNWEEPYIFGNASQAEYERLKKTSPSYRDKFDLLSLELGDSSEWMLFDGDDIGAHVKRKSDGKKFLLGLSELKATEKKSRNAQLLDDFSVFLVNNR